jgi:flagellar P-ring protein precursor FlgI
VNAAFGAGVAHTEDSRSIRIVPAGSAPSDPVQLLAQIQAIEVQPDVPARVVINERTGTVVMGADIRVSKVALAHGNLTVDVRTTLTVSQPPPFSKTGETVVVPQREISAHEDAARVLTLEDGVSVGEIVDALNALGVSSRDMIAIFQSMKAAGALHAELVVL